MDLVDRLRAGQGDFLLFGITPPKASTDASELSRIKDVTLRRLQAVGPDGVALYDIADEQDRNAQDRPFPFLPTLDPSEYRHEYLTAWDRPAVIYRAVGKYEETDLHDWMHRQDPDRVACVLVGASSSRNIGATSLERAYELRREANPDLLTGAVVIPERHTDRGDEHERMLRKQEAGVSFFVSQILYDANAAKNLVADYCDACESGGVAPRPIVFTHSVCGSVKTLDFLEWLGARVPTWVKRELTWADDTLEASAEQARAIAADMVRYGRRLGVPVGLNVESVSSRKTEIEASASLAHDLRVLLGMERGSRGA